MSSSLLFLASCLDDQRFGFCESGICMPQPQTSWKIKLICRVVMYINYLRCLLGNEMNHLDMPVRLQIITEVWVTRSRC